MTASHRPSRRRLQPKRSDLIRLRDGRELWLRPIEPEDAAPINGAFELLHDEEIRRRFLHPVKGLSADHLQRLVNPVPGREFVLVAAEPLPPGEALIAAVARLSAAPEHRDAEFALLVSHFVSGQGLGRRMFQRLIDWARSHDIHQLWGDILEDNPPMLSLARHMGFHKEGNPDSPGLARMVLDIAPATPMLCHPTRHTTHGATR